MDIIATWKPEYSVGHEDIDAQHKYLFEHAHFINQTQIFMNQFQ